MIALPVATTRKTSHIVSLFGKAKQFAIFNNNTIEVVPNEVQSGKKIASWLKEKGVQSVVVKHMGKRPFEALMSLGIKVYFCSEKLPSNEVVLKLLNNELTQVTPQNYLELLGEHEKFSASPKKCCHSKRNNFASKMGHSHCH